MDTPTPRRTALLEAADLIDSDRNAIYGEPIDNMTKIAALWTDYKGVEFTPGDVVALMALVKLARLAKTGNHRDSWIDLAGYAAIRAEVTGR